MDLTSKAQWNQGELPSNLYNFTNGDTLNYNGGKYVGTVNNNGTRSFSVAPETPFPNVTLNDIGGSAADYANTLNSGVNNAFSDYLKASQAQTSPLDIYSKLEAQAGMPQLRKTQNSLQGSVNSLEDALGNVKNNVSQSTYNSLATEAQRAGMVNAQSQPINDNLSKQSTALDRIGTQIQNGESNINNMVGLAVQGEQMALDPYKQGITVAQDNAARSMSGFTADSQNRLNLLLEKIKRDESISDAEWQQTSDLAKQAQQYKLALSNTLAEDSAKQPHLISVGSKSILYDPSTGQFITPPGGGGSGGGSSTGANPISGGGWS